MASRTVVIGSKVGLHARPASLFTQQVDATGLDIWISTEGEEPVDASSILMVMSLGVGHGEEVTLTSDDEGAEDALDSLVELLARDLDAE